MRGSKTRGATPASRRDRSSTTDRHRKQQSASFDEDEEVDLLNDHIVSDDQIDNDSDEEVNIDDIIAEMNGGGSRRAGPQNKSSPRTKKTRAPVLSRARGSSSRTQFDEGTTQRRMTPRQRFAHLTHSPDVDSDGQFEDVTDQVSDDLQQELDDLESDSEDEAVTTLRRSTRQSSRIADSARSSGRADTRSTRTARRRRIAILDDDDSEDDFYEVLRPRECRGRSVAEPTRRQRRRIVIESEDEDDDDLSESEEEATDEDGAKGEEEGDYARSSKRKLSSPVKPSVKRQRLTRGNSKSTPHHEQSGSRPRRKAATRASSATPVCKPSIRFALQGELPEPQQSPPSRKEESYVWIDESDCPTDLKDYVFLDGIAPRYSPSDLPSEEESEQANAQEMRSVSDAGFESEEVELSEEPEAHTDRHWSTCKRCADGPTLPLYTKALTQLKRAKEREANKRRGSPERIGPRGRQRKSFIEDTSGRVTALQAAEEWVEVLEDRAGWFECKTCSVSWHWGCLPADTQKAILADINCERYALHQTNSDKNAPALKPVSWIDVDEFVDTDSCPECSGYASYCTICKADVHGDRPVKEQLGFTHAVLAQYLDPPDQLTATRMFRCKRCSRATHYECLARAQTEGGTSVEETARSIQEMGWLCSDCHRCPPVEKIIAWRQLDRSLWTDEQAKKADYAILSAKENLPREYLVKFKGKSFRDTEWVPHDWLRILHQPLLASFLAKGSRLELEPAELIESASALNTARKNHASLGLGGSRASAPTSIRTTSVKMAVKVDEEGEVDVGPPGPVPDAQHRIPKPWKTPDRILAVKFYSSVNEKDDDNMNEVGGDIVDSDTIALESLDLSDCLRSWEHAAKFLIKWQDQPYEGSTWEDPPTRRKQSDIFYECQEAYRSFLSAQKVTFPALTADEKRAKRQRRLAQSGSRFRALDAQPHCIEGGDLLDFQLEGVNWLRYGWYHEKPGILADEMGLGKTVQIITFLASIWKEGKAGPFLVVVPNATLPNWLREFEKWMPQFRVVPYWGEVSAREMISKYELFHSKKTLEKMGGSIRPIKFHVVIASDTTVRISSRPLRKVEHWDVIVVDEGQNLKSGKSLLLKNLNEMNAEHRIIMSGTPLNNNVTELFNLLNWLEPGGQWKDVKALEAEFSALKPEVIEKLQKRLKPYFLRRLKKEVLDLPPKIELIVPTSLRPIQKRIYRSILESNIEDIQALAATRATGSRKGRRSTVTNLSNTLMQLRKCIQHPYLIAPDLETFQGEDNYEASWEHQRLVDASAKLSILQRLLPKLKAGGHRVLLFSQFVIGLDIVEVFLRGEGYKFLRLDGSIGQKQRQKGIDAFNAPDSPYFIYMISTRAGGIGINLATADTVIIMDPDWNPHIDMQAIARAHRIGQTKKLLVFTLMCKATAEEKIIETAKRKMMLDHLIVQNLEKADENPSELESILKFGAQALFAEGGTEESDRDVRYTDGDLDSLLRRREDASGDENKALDDARDESGELKASFSYARVWEIDRPAADGPVLAPTTAVDDDFWADLLQKHRDEAANRAEGARERGAQERRASRRDRIKAILQDEEEAAEPADPPANRGPGRPKKVAKPPVDEDFRVVDASDSDDHEWVDTAQEEDEQLPAVQALRQQQIRPSNTVVASAAAAAASASTSSNVEASDAAAMPGSMASATASAAPATAPPKTVKLNQGRSAASSSTSALPKTKPRLFDLARLQQELIVEHRLPSPSPLSDLDTSQPVTAVQPDHLAAMRRVILSLLPDGDFTLEVASRSLSSILPKLSPPHMRFQLTNTHIKYYMHVFKAPQVLFEAAFAVIADDAIPQEVLALPHGGATVLDWRMIRQLLLQTATYMVMVLRAPKDQPPWIRAIRDWNQAHADKPAPAVIDIANSPPANNLVPPEPCPATSSACADVLRDVTRREAWLNAIQKRDAAEVTDIARLVTCNPLSMTSPSLMLIVQKYIDGKGRRPVYEPSEHYIRSGLPVSVAFGHPDVVGPHATTTAAAVAASESSPCASQRQPNRVAAALSRLSAFSGGSPVRNDVSEKDLSKLNLDVAVNHRKPLTKTASSSTAGSPRSSISLSPVPTLASASQSTPVATNAATDADEGQKFVISDQTCIICGGAFHYLNRCPEMQDVTRASARWFQLCDQLKVLTSRGLTDGDPDVATIKTTIKVMARKLNGSRSLGGQKPLVPPFA